MKINKREVGQRIHELRNSNNLTMQKLAKGIGASGKSTISTWENGITLPRPIFLKKLANFFHVDTDFIKYGTLQNYLENLIFDDLNSKNSVLSVNVEEYLKVRTDYLTFVNGIPMKTPDDVINYQDIMRGGRDHFLMDALNSDFQKIKRSLGDKLRYENDSEILESLNSWFMVAAARNSLTFLGCFRLIKNGIDQPMPATGGMENDTVADVRKRISKDKTNPLNKLSDAQILDNIYSSKLGQFQISAVNELNKLKQQYEHELKKYSTGENSNEED